MGNEAKSLSIIDNEKSPCQINGKGWGKQCREQLLCKFTANFVGCQ